MLDAHPTQIKFGLLDSKQSSTHMNKINKLPKKKKKKATLIFLDLVLKFYSKILDLQPYFMQTKSLMRFTIRKLRLNFYDECSEF